jgi:diaminohydroxyphosphoribosylaminopyrimidine deaminase / 5-amino-6-(5-phosphoribosylamino)uracil reductase
MDYELLMKRALQLATNGTGYVSPNPRVGAVIYRDGEIIGEGWHAHFGGNHAEVEAINNSSYDDFSDATLIVNLEPCSHTGKTPPCAPFVIEKKFKRVVIGIQDPNPEVSGNGIKMLNDAGIEVVEGVLENDCKWINRFFIKNVTTGETYNLIKIAQSMDGCIATSGGDSKWISSEESRRRVHKLRAELDAVLIGKKTASKDNPELTVRLVNGRNPRRIVLDSQLSLPLSLKIFTDEQRTDTVVICSHDVQNSRKAENLEIAGVNIFPYIIDNNGKYDLPNTLKVLSSQFNVASILVEGGAGVYSTFASNGLIDEINLFTAPIIIGNGLSSFNSYKTFFVKDAAKFEIKAILKSDTDFQTIAIKKQ